MQILLVFVVGLACVARGQNVPSVDEALAKVNEVIDLPALKNLNLSALNLSALNISSLPIGEAESALRSKCEKNGGKGSYEAAKKAATDLYNCTKDLIVFSELKKEIEDNRHNGELDTVFKKYCNKKPVLKKCFSDFTTGIEPCLEPVEKDNKKIVHVITDKILDFVCFKEGDRIALFIAAKGPECFQQQAQAIGQCANQTYGSEASQITSLFPAGFPADGKLPELPKIDNIPTLVFDHKACSNMEKLQTCVVAALEGCKDPTPANLLDSIFRFIKKVTPCEKMLEHS